jgi:cytochrome c biogenesis protein CcmG/thiol:disulfide interchange protein DsbE
MSNSLKALVVTVLVCGTLLYSHYEKRKVDELTLDRGFILQTLPDFEAKIVGQDATFKASEFVATNPGTMVHFWGTWCAPCETEFPDLLEYAKKVSARNIKFVLVAMNDTEKKVRMFLKRFKNMPDNITVVVKEDTSLMARFGTFKVPETYLFDQSGGLLTKYVGPQNWLNNSYVRQIDRLVYGDQEKLKKIETH